MTSRSRDAACAAVAKFTASFADGGPPLIPTSELKEHIDQGRRVILVDVRTREEQVVSMIPGAIPQEVFESDVLPGLTKVQGDDPPLVVTYCTVGYRSGLYGRTLMDKHGLTNVRNGEGVLMWTFDGTSLVKPVLGENGAPTRAPTLEPQLPGAVGQAAVPAVLGSRAAPAEEDRALVAVRVKLVHVYGKPWDIAAEGYQTVYFSAATGAWKYVAMRCGDWAQPILLWTWVFILFYLFFTPACGVMYRCGCQLGASKWGQVETCNLFDDVPHRCPWCSCTGLSCIFVCFDSKAFRDIPLLDLLPDGFFVTVVTVSVLLKTWQLVDRLVGEDYKRPTTVAKAVLALVWFIAYCVLLGGIFFALNPEYPYFLGISRNLGPAGAASSLAAVGRCSSTAGSDVFRSREWLRAALETGAALLDARGSFDGHLSTAAHSPWPMFTIGSGAPVGGLLANASEIVFLLASLGASPTRTIVVYGEWEGGWGEEGRIYWMLKVLGFPEVFILEGGLAAYREAYPQDTALSSPAASAPSLLGLLDPALDARAMKADLSVESRLLFNPFLVDVRTLGEFDGTALDEQGHPAFGVQRPGHAVGAAHFLYAEHFGDDGCLVPCSALTARLEALGWSPGRRIVAYCTGGIRSAFFWAVARHCGLDAVANYDGSMWEYAADGSLPMTLDPTPIEAHVVEEDEPLADEPSAAAFSSGGSGRL